MTTRQMAKDIQEALDNAGNIGSVAPGVSFPAALRTVHCPQTPIVVPGIATADALDALDCVGLPFTISVPPSGTIIGANWFDLSHQGSAVRVHLFKKSFTMAASDAAWSPSDADVINEIAVLNFVLFEDEINSYVSFLDSLNRGYSAPGGVLYVGVSTPAGSTPTYTAGSMPALQLIIQSDDPTWAERS